MGLTRDYLKFVSRGFCNLIGSPNGAIQFVDSITCAVIAADQLVFYNVRTLEKTNQIVREGRTVTAFKLSPDKCLVAIGYDDGEVHLYQRGKNEIRSSFAGHRTGVNCIAFSADSLTLASGGKDSSIVVWDLVSESGICRLGGHKSTITHLQFAQRDRFLVSSSKDSQLKFWCLTTKSCFYTLATSSSEVYTFALIDDDRLLLVGNAEIELLVFELCWQGQDGWEDERTERHGENEDEGGKRPRTTLVGHDQLLLLDSVEKSAAFDTEQQANRILRCIKRGALIRQAKGRALQLAVSSDEAIVCCVGSDSILDIYRHFTVDESKKRYQKKLRKLRLKADSQPTESEKETNEAMENEVSRDVTTLITRIGDFRADSKLKWVDLCEGFAELNNKNVREYRFFCLLKSNDVQGVSLRIEWKSNATNALPLVSLGQRSHRFDVRSVCIALDSSFFVTGSHDCALVWDSETLSPVNKLTEDGLSQISASIVVFGDKQIVLGTRTGALFLFDLLSCELLAMEEKAHESAISEICAFPEKDGFISCGNDKQARFWHYEWLSEIDGSKRLSMRSVRRLELNDEALCAALSPNGKFVAFGLLDTTARVFFRDSLKFFVSLYGHSLPIYCIDISVDSKLVVTGSADKSVKIWGLDFGDCHRSLFAHDDIVTCVKFSKEISDERLFWSASKDGTLKQWDADKFHWIQTLNGHTDQIDALAITADGRTLISASRDKSVRLWQLTDELIVLQEEEEREREKEYEQRLVDEEDIIPGEPLDTFEGGLAPLKSIDTIKSTESIMEAIEIVRNERMSQEAEDDHKRHPLLMGYSPGAEHRFVADGVQKIRHSHLEKSLMTLPFTFVPDLLKEMGKCVRSNYKSDLAERVILFLTRIHHNQIIHSLELLSLIDDLRTVLPKHITDTLNCVGLNIAALKFLQMRLESRQNAKMFIAPRAENDEKTSKKKKQRRKVKEIAFVSSVI
ncbi:hypothetical protein niasHT_034079 [Heterodera trifolii]|uniref:Small-subunit processome Utp12 domain-containing protein n=1 Tax=Heterodera trifolii TaxID=157864 RepID=A0ABD2I3F4_9BILA